jgi:hypothetical protein
MPDTDKLVFSPLVGFDNIVQTEDEGVFKPHVRLMKGLTNFIPINTSDSAGNYNAVVGGTGRKGAMKTALIFVPIDNFNDDENVEIEVFVQIPNGLRGLADPKSEDLPKNLTIDPSLFSPIVHINPAYNSLFADGDSEPMEDLATMQAGPFGDDAYVSAVTAKKEEESGTIANAGTNGYLKIQGLLIPTAGEKINELQIFQLVVDFSHSISN